MFGENSKLIQALLSRKGGMQKPMVDPTGMPMQQPEGGDMMMPKPMPDKMPMMPEQGAGMGMPPRKPGMLGRMLGGIFGSGRMGSSRMGGMMPRPAMPPQGGPQMPVQMPGMGAGVPGQPSPEKMGMAKPKPRNDWTMGR